MGYSQWRVWIYDTQAMGHLDSLEIVVGDHRNLPYQRGSESENIGVCVSQIDFIFGSTGHDVAHAHPEGISGGAYGQVSTCARFLIEQTRSERNPFSNSATEQVANTYFESFSEIVQTGHFQGAPSMNPDPLIPWSVATRFVFSLQRYQAGFGFFQQSCKLKRILSEQMLANVNQGFDYAIGARYLGKPTSVHLRRRIPK